MSTTRSHDPQPLPTEGTGPSVIPEVIRDLEARAALGRVKYGRDLRADNGRDHLLDLYHELLDACAYIKAEMMRRDAVKGCE